MIIITITIIIITVIINNGRKEAVPGVLRDVEAFVGGEEHLLEELQPLLLSFLSIVEHVRHFLREAGGQSQDPSGSIPL